MTTELLGPTEQYVSPAEAARITWEDRHDTTNPDELWQAVADAVLAAAGELRENQPGMKVGNYPDGEPFGYFTEEEREKTLAAAAIGQAK